MSGRPHRDDRGLAAVARVRGVRETDSRIGLRQVLAEEAAATARVAALEAGLGATTVPGTTTPGALLALRAALAGTGVLLAEGREAAATARVVSDEARVRWQADRARLAAVTQLLERRAARRRAEAERAAAREADDLAAQRWLREAR